MAEFGQRKKPIIPIKKSDLKQAILKKNKALESKNKTLESSLKEKEKSLKALEKEYSDESKKLGQLLKNIAFQEELFQKIKGGVYSNDKLLSEKLKKVGVAESELCDYEIGVEKLEERERNLLDKISKLEFYKSKCLESKGELAGIQAKKDSALDDLASVKDEVNEIKADGEKMEENYNQSYNSHEEEIEKRQKHSKELNKTINSTKDDIVIERDRLDNVRTIISEEKNIADNELQAVKNLKGREEDKYLEWEQKVKKITKKADREEGRIKRAKERFEKWRIGVLEEVARMKLKKKVDNIDKAGLSEILNG